MYATIDLAKAVVTAAAAAGVRDKIRAMTRGHLASMAFMATTNLAHTFVCPGAMFDGRESPERTVTLDELGGRGAMRVSFADVARVIVDDLNVGALLGHRVCVAPASPAKIPVHIGRQRYGSTNSRESEARRAQGTSSTSGASTT